MDLKENTRKRSNMITKETKLCGDETEKVKLRMRRGTMQRYWERERERRYWLIESVQ